MRGENMTVQYVDVRPHPGGYVRITAVVDGDIQTAAKLCEKAKQRPYELILKPITHKRTLTANAYYQVLLDKLTAALRADRRELHRQLLASYGVTKELNGEPVFVKIADYIDPKELGDLYLDPVSYGNGDIVYRVLKGSSEMNSAEFAALLDGLISECRGLGIETLPDEEIKRMYEVSQQ
jgi:hypothetical protein